MKIGIIKETKTPPDRRVAITPEVAKAINEHFSDVKIVVEPKAVFPINREVQQA